MAQARKEDEQQYPIITSTQTLHTAITTTSTSSCSSSSIQEKEVEKELNAAPTDQSRYSEASSSPITSRALYFLGDLTCSSASRFAQWLLLARSRSGRLHHPPRFPNHYSPLKEATMSLSSGEQLVESASLQRPKQASEISLWERLGRASEIDSREFSWDMLSSIHRSEHTSSTEYSEDELNKALEVTVNSGGVVFFALFRPVNDDPYPKEAAAVIKIPSSRMATQSERLGYAFAKCVGVSTPKARVIHNSSDEWHLIKDATEKKRDAAVIEGDCGVEVTCLELLEALELSRCLFLMNYVHGSPLLESTRAFHSQEVAEKTAAELGRVLLLDLVIRNEDRLPCRQLGWRGNSANLLLAEEVTSPNIDASNKSFEFVTREIEALQKEGMSSPVDGMFSIYNPEIVSHNTDISDIMDSSKPSNIFPKDTLKESESGDFRIVAIDSCIPRRPPAGKRANDHAQYPKLVELLLNNVEYSSNLLYDITGGKVGCPLPEKAGGQVHSSLLEWTTVVNELRSGFRAALRDLQRSHIFLLTLYQKLDSLLRVFLTLINKTSSVDSDREDCGVPGSPSNSAGVSCPCLSPSSKDRSNNENNAGLSDPEIQKTTPRASILAYKENLDTASPVSRENWHAKNFKGNSLRLTTKLRDFNRYAKVDAELNRELEQWNETLRKEVIELCQKNNFSSGFFEGSETNGVVDAYELKVRLEHILERIALISDAANTEKPSLIIGKLFIGGTLAAKSVYTLQHLGITHILCLCSNEIGQSESQYPDLFEYKNFSIFDHEDSAISDLFEEASDFIDRVEHSGGGVLVHCFEGKSRSATVVLAYLMLRKNFTLLQAWNTLKKVHRRAQPNDGFARTLLVLDKKLHGKVSMEWQQRKPTIRVCRICEKNGSINCNSLKHHRRSRTENFKSQTENSHQEV